jgi:hypothetical protein
MRTSYDSTMVHIAGRTPQEVTDAIAEATKEAWERLCKKLETDSPVVQGFTVVPLSWEFWMKVGARHESGRSKPSTYWRS